MANLVRWEPFNDFVTLRDAMDKLFEESFIQPRFLAPFREHVMGQLPLDVIETEDELVVKATVAGYKPEEIDVTIVGDTLTIKGEVKEAQKEEPPTYLLQERRLASFKRSFTLPVDVQADQAKAEFEYGVLTLALPKAEAIKPKQIKINVKNGAKSV
jgi:HSP20 family protein